MTRQWTSPSQVEFATLIALQDNYVYLMRAPESAGWVVVDPSDAAPVEQFLCLQPSNSRQLLAILNTHHHHDHVGGNKELVSRWKCPVFCSRVDGKRIPEASHFLEDEETFQAGGLTFTAYLIPGHTLGQMAFELISTSGKTQNAAIDHAPEMRELFVGDTVFAMGCGRLLEGSASQMADTLERLAGFGARTRIYVGHEYSRKNAAFAQLVEPSNRKINERLASIEEELMQFGTATPTLMSEELETNPFFRTSELAIQSYLGVAGDNKKSLEAFTKLRQLRNSF